MKSFYTIASCIYAQLILAVTTYRCEATGVPCRHASDTLARLGSRRAQRALAKAENRDASPFVRSIERELDVGQKEDPIRGVLLYVQWRDVRDLNPRPPT